MGAIGVMVNVMEKQFAKYMDHVFPFLDKGLKNFQEYDVCKMTVTPPHAGNPCLNSETTHQRVPRCAIVPYNDLAFKFPCKTPKACETLSNVRLV